MRIYPACVVALSLAAALPGRAVAQDLRGGELRINQVTAGDQLFSDVAVSANGDFVAVWLQGSNLAQGALEVRARQFHADGRAKGRDRLVARIASYPFGLPRVAADAAGRFLVVWVAPPAPPGRISRVFGQRFDSSGGPLGSRFSVRASELSQNNPDVAMTGDGRAVLVWENATGRVDPEGVSIVDVYARRLGSDGRFAGAAFVAVPDGEIPRVALRVDGGFAIASQIYGFESSFYDIYLSLYAADDGVLREPFEISAGATRNVSQVESAIAIANDGRIFVAWTDFAGDSSVPGSSGDDIRGVVAQRFAPDGTPMGDNFRVNTFFKGSQSAPSVVATPRGGFLVAWTTGASQDGDDDGIFARHFAADGRRLGNEIRMNLGRDGRQWGVALDIAANGRGVAAWRGPDGDKFGIFARRLAPPEP